MQMIEFWIVRKGANMRQFEPEIGAILSNHSYKQCHFCRDDRELGAVIAFCWREPGAESFTAGICVDCAQHDDATLVRDDARFPECSPS